MRWILLKALILVLSDKQVLIIVDDECDVSCFKENRRILMSILSKNNPNNINITLNNPTRPINNPNLELNQQTNININDPNNPLNDHSK